MLALPELPHPIDRTVRRFCADISTHEPCYVNVRPEKWALHHECFPNVARKVQQAGGRTLYGWAIWRCPILFIEAEHHCVYESRAGRLVDITPQEPGFARVLFLRDDTATYDPDTTYRRDNIRSALTDDWRVARLLELFASRVALLNTVPEIRKAVHLSGERLQRMREYEAEIKALTLDIAGLQPGIF